MKPPTPALHFFAMWRRKLLERGVWGFFEGHDPFIKAGCPVPPQALGIDDAKAVERAETVLLLGLDNE